MLCQEMFTDIYGIFGFSGARVVERSHADSGSYWFLHANSYMLSKLLIILLVLVHILCSMRYNRLWLEIKKMMILLSVFI